MAPGGRVLRLHRRRRPDAPGRSGRRAGRGARPHHRRHVRLPPGRAADARRRPVDVAVVAVRRRHGRAAARLARPARGVAARSSARRSTSSPSSATPSCARWSTRGTTHGPFDVSSLFSVGSGGAPLTPSLQGPAARDPARTPPSSTASGRPRPAPRARSGLEAGDGAADGRHRVQALRRHHQVLDEVTPHRGRAGLGRHRPGGAAGPDPAGLLQRPGEDGRDLRRGRRPPLGAHRRHGHRRRRRHDHAARPRLGVHQHRAARRSSPRRSRRCSRRTTSSTTSLVVGRRRRALGPAGRRGRAAGRRRRRRRSTTLVAPRPRPASPATRCRKHIVFVDQVAALAGRQGRLPLGQGDRRPPRPDRPTEPARSGRGARVTATEWRMIAGDA